MIDKILLENTIIAVENLYGQSVSEKQIQIQKTKKEFDGDLTIVVFPLLKVSKSSPEKTAEELGNYLSDNLEFVTEYNVIKGFLNLLISDKYWLQFLQKHLNIKNFGFTQYSEEKPVVIEYSAPNTNKPMHLGHIRNNLLGYSIAEILKANGLNVKKVNLINDRGIHICKSMIAWQQWGDGETPGSTGMKGDHLIGKYYVLFDKKLKEEIKTLTENGFSKEQALDDSPLMQKAYRLLRRWEYRDEDVIELWKMMNGWAYDGFDETYERLGVDFDKIYYESDTYLLGKELVEEGLREHILIKKDDGSVWADLTKDGLDEKLLLRPDGTSVYMTQDLGTAQLRYNDYHPEKLLYVVGNEQNYHFEVLKLILLKLGKKWAENILHLSYGMVELPEGKMKSREGKVVDADDLIDEMLETARRSTEELGKLSNFNDEEALELYRIIGLGALKYFILKVDPRKNMLFNPSESIDFNGNTGPFIQYTHARIQSVLRKAADGLNFNFLELISDDVKIISKEKEVIKLLHDFPFIIADAGENYSPAVIANYIYHLVKEYNQFYQETPILKAESEEIVAFRLQLSFFVGRTIKDAMKLLGIEVPDRM